MSLKTFMNLSESKQNAIIQSGIKAFAGASYSEASTDVITREGGISKGVFFHYFGSKKSFYLFILEHCYKILAKKKEEPTGEDFYQILFDSLDEKIRLGAEHPLEVQVINNAAREMNKQVAADKAVIMLKYETAAQQETAAMLERALSTLTLKKQVDRKTAMNALLLYERAILMQYLKRYSQKPYEFFNHYEQLKNEMKSYLDLFLFGIQEATHD